jgi:RNA polymerase sigma factor (sigma-70 family)
MFGARFENSASFRNAGGGLLLRTDVATFVEQPVQSFEDVFRDSRTEMLRTAYLIVGSHALAEELVQEAFTRMYRQFATIENPGGYLRTTVVRLCVQSRDRAAMETERLASSFEPPATAEPEIDEMWDRLTRLRPERRAVLVLRFYNDMSPSEIADVLGWRDVTVRTRLHRGLADLRREMQR